jgi:ParB family chromosome partitioning protein
MEEAQAYERLVVDFGMTQEEVARRVGKNRATVANMLRLLRLPRKCNSATRKSADYRTRESALVAV